MKKLISLLTIFTMVVTLFASFNVTTVSATSTNLYKWEYFDPSDKAIYTSLNGTTYGGQKFQISGSDTLKNVTYHEGNDTVSDDPYLNIISDKYIWNRTAAVTMSKAVMDFNFKMYIPKADLVSSRYLYFYLSKKDSSGNYNNSTYGGGLFVLTNSTNGSAQGSSELTNATSVYSKTTAVTGNVWHQVNIRVFTHKEGQLLYGMYLDGVLVCLYKSSADDISFDDIGIRQIFFKFPQNTYVKDIRLDFEDFDPTFAPETDETYIYNSNVTFNSNTVTSANAINVKNYGTTSSIIYQTSSQTADHFKSGSNYTNVSYEAVDETLKITLTPNIYGTATYATIQNFKEDLTSEIASGETKYIQMSYDVKNPEGSESALKEQKWSFGIKTAALSSSVYNITSRMQGNKIWFENVPILNVGYDGDETTRKSVEYKAESDKWYRLIALLKVTNSGTNYLVHSEGYVLDIEADSMYKIYESDEVIAKLNGADGFVLTQARTDIETVKDETKTPVVTYYDNITSRIWNTDFSLYYRNVTNKLPADKDYVFDIGLTVDNNVATAIGRDADGNGAQKILIAGYDASGRMVKCAVSDNTANIDAEKGVVEFSWDFSSYSDITKVRAFMFGDISSFIPLANVVDLDL